MIAFHGESTLKQSLIEFTKENIEAGIYKRGRWLFKEVGKNDLKCGCFYGGMTQTEDQPREKASEQYGLPLWYTYVTENIYENLPAGEWEKYPLEAIECIKVGSDLNRVRSLFNRIILTDLLRFVKKGSRQESAINQCISLFNIPFNEINKSAARSAWSAAWSAASAERSAASAASSAAWSAARSASSAAWSASSASSAASAESAASAAWSAASAERSAASAASMQYYSFLKKTLIECCESELTSKKEILQKEPECLARTRKDGEYGEEYQ